MFPRRSIHMILVAAMLFSLAAMACNINVPWGSPGASPKLPPLPPVLVSHAPERGEEQPATAPIVLTFDQAMDRASVEEAFNLSPAVPGKLRWDDDKTLRFVPSGEGFERDANYQVSVTEAARARNGLALRQSISFRFKAMGFLQVSQVIPSRGAQDVASDSTITVIFNRPVVPVVAVSDQVRLPQPLTLDPPAAGRGEWLNTSIYVFHPDALTPGTTYTAQIGGELKDTTGADLEQDFVWRFTIQSPRVILTSPVDQQSMVELTVPISVTFNQPMDHASTEAAFSLRVRSASGGKVSGTFQWVTNTMGFVPSRRLELDRQYYASVAAGAKAAAGAAGMQSDFTWTFLTVPYPRIISTSPANGVTDAAPYQSFDIVFSAPIDRATVMRHIRISPEPTATNVYTSWWHSERTFHINFNPEPSTEYTVRIEPGIMDPYGNPTGEDLTVKFTTMALFPYVRLNVDSGIGTYSAYTDTRLYAVYRNVATMDFALWQMSLSEFWQATTAEHKYQPRSDALIRQWSASALPDLVMNEIGIHKTYLAGDTGGALRPGLYCLQVASPEVDRYDWKGTNWYYGGGTTRHELVVNSVNVILKTAEREALVWATDMQSGQPVPNAPVTLYDIKFNPIASGQTDQDGVFTAQWDAAMYTNNTVYAVVGEPGSNLFGLSLSGWSGGIDPWSFGVPSEFDPDPHRVYFTTDRPIYRPGQIVYFKAVVRLDDDARYKLYQGGQLPVSIVDPNNKEVYSDTLTVSPDMATVNGQFKLDDQATLGQYRIYLALPNETYRWQPWRLHSISFLVAAYVRPEFMVDVTTDKERYAQGDTINVDVLSNYYFGGAVTDAKLEWNVIARPYAFEYKGQGSYAWIDWDNFYGGSRSSSGSIASGRGKTDASGHFTVPVKADLGKNDYSQWFTIEASVTDINDRVVANRTDTVVHQGLFYIGLRPERYVGQAGEKQTVNIKTVDWDSKDYTQANLVVTFYRRQWFNVMEQTGRGPVWTTTLSDTAVATQTVTTDADGLAIASFVPPKGGSYRIVATGQDGKDNKIRSGTYLWIASAEYVSWRQENNDRIQLVADKNSYALGETASILVPSPFQGEVKALVTVERGRVLSRQVITLKTNSEVLKVPVTPDMSPNAFVSVVIVKGVDATTPIATFKVGYASFAVSTMQQEIKVSLSADKTTHYAPGETVTYTIQTTDYMSKPVQAELSLAVADLAVLSLTDPNAPPIVEGFYTKRGLGIRTASTLVMSVDRLNIKLQTEIKGGGGGEGGPGDFAPRQKFFDTAYWSATVRTDATGKAQVQVLLPDNLTTWRLTAKAVTADTRVGESTLDIISTKDLLVRPVTPRFFVVGDKSNVAMVVHNNTDKPLDVDVQLEGQGVSIDGQATQKVSVPSKDKVRVEWSLKVQDVSAVHLVFSARGGGLYDASKPPVGLPPDQHIPVYRYSTPEVVATSGSLDEAGDRLEVVALPPQLDTTQGNLTVRLDPSLAAGMTDGLTWLEHYPYECAEQIVSKFLPNVCSYRALKKLGLAEPDLEGKLREQVSIALQRLYGLQHNDGGWGWWVNDPSHPLTTGWAVLGMVKAREAGFSADTQSLKRALDYLDAQLIPPTQIQDYAEANRQAFILYVTAEAGRDNSSRAVAFYDARRQALDNYGKAYLALALSIWQKDNRSRVDALLGDLNNSAIVSATGAHWEEPSNDWFSWNTDTRTTAIVLDLLARFDAKNGLAPNVVRWLMNARTAGHWETTQETAWAIIALTDWMDATGELRADYSWEVELNTQPWATGTVSRTTVKQSTTLTKAVADLLRDQANALLINRSAGRNQTGEGRLYYSAYLKTYIPVEKVRSLSRGIVVARQYFRADDPCFRDTKLACTPVTSAQVGEVLQVRLSIVAPADLHYVVVEDPLPAGAEAVDTSLKTTMQTGQAPQLNRVGRGSWGWWWFNHTELRDEKVALFATYLPKGSYEYTYQIRTGLAGSFQVMPSVASQMYFPEVFGRGDGMLFQITK